MVLESIINPKKAEDKPWGIFFISVIFSFIAIFLANQLFPSQSSIFSVALVTIFFVPFFQRLFSVEEKKDEVAVTKKTKQNPIARHKEIIIIYAAFFLGIIFSFSFVYIFFPTLNNVFALQIDWFRSQGVSYATQQAIQQSSFERYFLNNSQVMIISFILSLLFGAGAIFIISWNASVIAVYSGLIANKFSATLGTTTAYLYGVPVALGSILLHGIPEILAYFLAGIAGGILSVGLLREKFMSKEFKEVLKDAVIFLMIAEFLIVVAAWLEAL